MALRARSAYAPRCVSVFAKCDVMVVGAGVPKRGMGWYHAKQILDGDVPAASLSAVVEPWFLGPGADSPPGATFATWAEETGKGGVAFCKSVADAPPAKGGRMALISGRTADNPRLLKEVIEAGCTAVYLEKPGAPTAGRAGLPERASAVAASASPSLSIDSSESNMLWRLTSATSAGGAPLGLLLPRPPCWR